MLIFPAIPLVLNMLAVVFYRGAYRRGAIGLLPLMAGFSLADIYSGALGGNLTGLLSIFFAYPLAVLIMLLGVGSAFTKNSTPRKATSRSARWATIGALVVLGGLMLVAPLSCLGNNTAARRFLEWWSHQSWGLLLGPFGMAVGALSGFSLSLVLRPVSRSRGPVH
jgi:hypothetical protein